MNCPSCGSTEIEWHDAGGDAVCVSCGTVCEESTIVSSIEFSETGGGSATVVGQYVSETCSKPYSGGMHASARSRYGFMRTSRETTLAKGRASIAEVAARLRLHSHYIDSAHRLFTSAVQHNFVQGRKTMHVVAVCLYIKCREEKSPHMLIDFSDALSVNVFTLGSCYLKFCRTLNIETPLIDPSLYIVRFAGKMELGNKVQTVATAALRLVAQMKRDWILTGRRPAGICAAALLIAARQNGFPRTQGDIVKVLRVCGMTVRNRMEEFELTPAAQLTMQELRQAENEPCPALEAPQDPPAFTKNRLLVVPTLQPPALLALPAPPGQMSNALALSVDSSSTSSSSQQTTRVEDKRRKRKQSASTQRRRKEREELYEDVGEQLQQQVYEHTTQEPTATAAQAATGGGGEEDEDDDEEAHEEGPGRGSATQGEPTSKRHRGGGGGAPGGAPVESTGEEASDEEDEDDEDLRGFVLSSEEADKKGAIWSEMNRTYLSEKASKEKRMELELASGGGGRGGSDERGAKSAAKKKRAYTKAAPATTAEEAVVETIAAKKMSKKINYDALAGMFGGGPVGSDLLDNPLSTSALTTVTEEYQQPYGSSQGRQRRRAPKPPPPPAAQPPPAKPAQPPPAPLEPPAVAASSSSSSSSSSLIGDSLLARPSLLAPPFSSSSPSQSFAAPGLESEYPQEYECVEETHEEPHAHLGEDEPPPQEEDEDDEDGELYEGGDGEEEDYPDEGDW